MRTVLLDGDILIFESAVKGETHINWGGEVTTTITDFDACLDNFNKRVATCKERAEADHVILCLSCTSRHYWRHDLYPEYKGHRKGLRKPELLGALTDHVHDNWDTAWRPGLEADDLLGIMGTDPDAEGTRIICTSDKDMLQIPGHHLNHTRLDDGVFYVTEEEGNRWHLMQTLMGDSTDNYKGCPGIGPKRAEKMLDEAPVWETVEEAFIAKGLTYEDALLQARLARILQWNEYDFENKEPILWTP
jgi:DNA polymerase-1